ncbi:MAG: CPBP family intramembrane metalloprotease [Bacteroidales bacterium]|nr:CPBP family intramembrane metalloprotease [Bacteroidales bacterium]
MDRIKTIILNPYYWQRPVEMILLYFVLPLLLVFGILPIPLMIGLVIMGVSVVAFLQFDNTFDKKKYLNWKAGKKYFVNMLLFFVLSAVVMVVTIRIVDGSKLFIIVREDPLRIVKIAVFYPLFSVIPQGLAYRVLFFHRYADLFSSRWIRIVVSALFFSFGHVIYKSPLVMVLTFIAGFIFAYRYYQSKSFLLSVVEHSFYGVWLFISSLGIYFISSMVQ